MSVWPIWEDVYSFADRTAVEIAGPLYILVSHVLDEPYEANHDIHG